MNWLITGGCGFIGTSLIRQLLAEGGHAIRVIDNLSVGTRADLANVCEFDEFATISLPAEFVDGRVQFVCGDILEDQLAIGMGKGADVIVHLAANTGVGPSVENPRLDCVTNVLGTLNYLECARHNKVRRFVFASSGAPVGECDPPIHEEKVPHPVSPYGASKLAGEGYCSAYFRTYGVQAVALRFGNVYGPGSGHKNSVVAKFIKQAMKGERLEIYGDGSQTRDFLYIDDLVRAVLSASRIIGVGGETFQIATQRETTVGEIAELICQLLSERGIPAPKIAYYDARLGDVLRNFSDTTKARNQLAWSATINLRDGVAQTIDWFSGLAAVSEP